MAYLEVGEQRDGLVLEPEVHSKQDDDQGKRARQKLHTSLEHPGMKEMIRVLKHGRALKAGNRGGATHALRCLCCFLVCLALPCQSPRVGEL